jgi:hypothetical protein
MNQNLMLTMIQKQMLRMNQNLIWRTLWMKQNLLLRMLRRKHNVMFTRGGGSLPISRYGCATSPVNRAPTHIPGKSEKCDPPRYLAAIVIHMTCRQVLKVTLKTQYLRILLIVIFHISKCCDGLELNE